MRYSLVERDAPAPVTVPTGAYRVLVWGGRAVEVLESPADRDAAQKALRRCTLPAALAMGASVLSTNERGRAHALAFSKFAKSGAEGLASPQRAAPSSKAPAPAPIVAPDAPATTAATPSVEAPPVAVLTADPTPAPTATEEPEPMPATTAATCARCNNEPRARTTKRTRPGEETWGLRCRKGAVSEGAVMKAPRKKAPAKPSARTNTSKSKRAPARKSAATPAGALDAGLAVVERHAAVVAALGGVDAAEALAALDGAGQLVDVALRAGGVAQLAMVVDRVARFGA